MHHEERRMPIEYSLIALFWGLGTFFAVLGLILIYTLVKAALNFPHGLKSPYVTPAIRALYKKKRG